MSLLITIEGIDGSGKTTLINNLKKNAELNLITHNWRDTELGQKIWHLLNESRAEGKVGLPSTWTYIFLIFAAFDELAQQIIKPNLSENKTVLIDRYIDSTLVYQGLAGKMGVDNIQKTAEKTIDLPLPDITFILDIEPQQAQARLRKRKEETGEYTNWDNLNLEFHHRIRNYYLELKKMFPERIYIVDATKGEAEVAAEVKEIIQQICLPKQDLSQFVRVVIKNEKGELLLVKDKKWGWNLPGGKVEPGETPEAAARREIWEETNLVLENYEKIAERNVFYANLEKGNQYWKGYFFQANQYSGEIQNKEVKKIAEVKFIDINSTETSESRWSPSYQFYLNKIKNAKLTNLNKKPLLISIEGIDGSGKSSLVEKLKQTIPNSVATQSPRGTELGKKVWDLVTENLVDRKLITNVWTEFFLFTANHNEHFLTVIKPNLSENKTVLIDRYIDSTLVYQGIRGKLPIPKLVEVWENTINLPFPDLTFVLDIEPTRTAERVNQRRRETGEELNNWDKSNWEFHQKIRNGYLELKKYFPERIKIINAERTAEEVLQEVLTIIRKYEYKKNAWNRE